MAVASSPGTLVIACGALGRELQAVLAANGLLGAGRGHGGIRVEYLSADLHMTPARIPDAVEERILAAGDEVDQVLVGYADCGTAGRLDEVVARHGATRLPGAHCYEFLAGSDLFATLHDAEPGTFYLTDYLLRQFDRLVWRGLALDRHPELLDDWFGNYTRLCWISQFPTPELHARAREAADRLGLRLEHVHVGTGDLGPAVAAGVGAS
ncbi:MAG TPA: DUF1638 domain-containing protein [Nitriliruptoraceae bacterium]|nr:DUF1638 domain-containing protein [Nitriliruptoraceae bacterium]